MRIFLTGGTGFIGSHLLKQALAIGHEVVALRRPRAEPRIPLDKQPHWLEGGLSEDWSKALGTCEAFIHLAAYGVAHGAHDWEGCFQTNVINSLQLWRQAVDGGINRFLIVGSCFEYGRSAMNYELIPVTAPLEPTTAYAASKASATVSAHALAINLGLSMTIARPFHVYGEGEDTCRFWPTLVSAARKGEDLNMTAGQQVRDFQKVDHTVQQLLNLIENNQAAPGEPRTVNLGSGRPMTLLSFAKQEWARTGGRGVINAGAIPYRANEVMRYAPLIDFQNVAKVGHP
jgi:UDP-glucose 4-epimerase